MPLSLKLNGGEKKEEEKQERKKEGKGNMEKCHKYTQKNHNFNQRAFNPILFSSPFLKYIYAFEIILLILLKIFAFSF